MSDPRARIVMDPAVRFGKPTDGRYRVARVGGELYVLGPDGEPRPVADVLGGDAWLRRVADLVAGLCQPGDPARD